MSVVDDVIFDYFELVTRIPMSEIETMKKKVAAGENPMQFKKILAKEIVSFYHGEGKAEEAEQYWTNTFQKGEIPEELIKIKGENLMKALVSAKNLSSNSEFRRLIEEGAISDLETGEKIKDPNFAPLPGAKIKVGKKTFIEFQ